MKYILCALADIKGCVCISLVFSHHEQLKNNHKAGYNASSNNVMNVVSACPTLAFRTQCNATSHVTCTFVCPCNILLSEKKSMMFWKVKVFHSIPAFSIISKLSF
mmetsp:Transcript_6369/g.9333  ORF Transcript_6369/g.9333 Transcript_6369/m.9333 type:complete len:105 (+) Transcript_6369:86-400(+)